MNTHGIYEMLYSWRQQLLSGKQKNGRYREFRGHQLRSNAEAADVLDRQPLMSSTDVPQKNLRLPAGSFHAWSFINHVGFSNVSQHNIINQHQQPHIQNHPATLFFSISDLFLSDRTVWKLSAVARWSRVSFCSYARKTHHATPPMSH